MSTTLTAPALADTTIVVQISSPSLAETTLQTTTIVAPSIAETTLVIQPRPKKSTFPWWILIIGGIIIVGMASRFRRK